MSNTSKCLWFILKLVCILVFASSLASGIYILLTPDWNPENRLFFGGISFIIAWSSALITICVNRSYQITKEIKEIRQKVDEVATRVKEYQQRVEEYQRIHHTKK